MQRYKKDIKMIVLDVIQGEEDWHLYRTGIPTASCFKKIVTPKGKLSATSKKYMAELIVERLLGLQESFKSDWMERGNELEDEAVRAYEAKSGIKTSKVGIILTDDMQIGISPDAVVYEGTEIVHAVEIKCPAPNTFIEWKMGGKVPDEYYTQVQGQMWGMGLSKMDFCFYHPQIGTEIIEVERNEEFVNQLENTLSDFVVKLEKEYIGIVNG